MSAQITDLVEDLEARLTAARAYAKTDRATSDRFLEQALGTFRDLRKILIQNAASASRELDPLDCKRPGQPGQAQFSSANGADQPRPTNAKSL